ncbi:hypothetical protein FND36_12915 [Lachnospiraceae bacterium KGMB03038]|nr:hypothetical protein FND36_12915 [Lachnospiraceae bacterium KGMB03038]
MRRRDDSKSAKAYFYFACPFLDGDDLLVFCAAVKRIRRFMEDVLIDSAGVLAGAAILSWLLWVKRRYGEKDQDKKGLG